VFLTAAAWQGPLTEGVERLRILLHEGVGGRAVMLKEEINHSLRFAEKRTWRSHHSEGIIVRKTKKYETKDIPWNLSSSAQIGKTDRKRE